MAFLYEFYTNKKYMTTYQPNVTVNAFFFFNFGPFHSKDRLGKVHCIVFSNTNVFNFGK